MAPTLYTARLIGPEILEKGASNGLSCPVYRGGALVAPTSGTLSVWTPSNELLVNGQAVTVAGSIATYTISSGTLAAHTPSDGWRFEWTLLIAGSTHVFSQDGSLVYRRLYPVISDLDLERAHTDLARRRPSTEASWQDAIDEAWARLESRLIAAGKRPWLILAPSALRDAHVFLTLSIIYGDFASTGGEASAEWSVMNRYESKYEDAWKELTFPQREATTGRTTTPAIAPPRTRRSSWLAAGGPTEWPPSTPTRSASRSPRAWSIPAWRSGCARVRRRSSSPGPRPAPRSTWSSSSARPPPSRSRVAERAADGVHSRTELRVLVSYQLGPLLDRVSTSDALGLLEAGVRNALAAAGWTSDFGLIWNGTERTAGSGDGWVWSESSFTVHHLLPLQ